MDDDATGEVVISPFVRDEETVALSDHEAAPKAELGADDDRQESQLDDAVSLALMLRRLEAIEAAVGAFQDQASEREAIITRLFNENQELRVGEVRMALRPMVSDLLYMRDALATQAERLSGLGEQATADLLWGFSSQVEVTLDRCGVELVRASPGDTFDGNAHEVVGTAPTPEPGLDGTIFEVRGVGFRDRDTGRSLRLIPAIFYRLVAAQTINEETL